MRHRLPQFTHLFADETYAAGYYSYLWSDAMAADMWQAFEEAGDPWDAGAAARLKVVMAAGDSIEATCRIRPVPIACPTAIPVHRVRAACAVSLCSQNVVWFALRLWIVSGRACTI